MTAPTTPLPMGTPRPNGSVGWSKEEDEAIRAAWARRISRRAAIDALVVRMPQRSRAAIQARATKLGAGSARGRRWSPEEIALLRLHWGEAQQHTLCKLFDRPWFGIVDQARKQGLPSTVRGRFTVEAAAARCGVTRWMLMRLLGAAGFTVTRRIGWLPDRRRQASQYLVDFEVAELVVRWATEAETLEVAKARLGTRGNGLALFLRQRFHVGGRGRGVRTCLPPEIWDAAVRLYRRQPAAEGDAVRLELLAFAGRVGTGDAFTRAFAARATVRGNDRDRDDVALLPIDLQRELRALHHLRSGPARCTPAGDLGPQVELRTARGPR